MRDPTAFTRYTVVLTRNVFSSVLAFSLTNSCRCPDKCSSFGEGYCSVNRKTDIFLTTNLAFNFLSLSLFYSLLLAGRTHEVSSKIVRRIVWHLRVSQDFYAVLSALNAYNTGISRPSLVSFDQSRLPQLHRRVIENPISRDRLLLSPVSPPG